MAAKYPDVLLREDCTDQDDNSNSGDSSDSNEINKLVYVIRDDGSYGGWRTELLAEEITGKVEGKFLLCNYCRGMLRDACLFEKDGKQELRCSVCSPIGVNKQTAQLNCEIVDEKQIKCPLKGCDWATELGELLHHLEECELFPVACPLGCRDERGEVSRVERRGVGTHRTCCLMRTVKCEYCSISEKACDMNGHLEVCEDFPIPCPNKCSEEFRVERKNKSIHLSQECPLQETECPYSQYGCEAKVIKRKLEQHEKKDIHKHMKLTMLTISDLQKEVTSLKSTISGLASMGDLEWEIDEIEDKLLDEEQTYSDPFYVGLYKFQAYINWDSRGFIAIFFRILKEKWDSNLVWPLRYRYTIELVNQLDEEDNYIKSREVTKESLENFQECFKKPTTEKNNGFGLNFISQAEILKQKYSLGDGITIRIRVEQLPAW